MAIGPRTTLTRNGTHSIDELELPLEVEELKQRLVEHFSRPTYRPPDLPAVATKLLSLSQENDVDAGKVLALLESDPLLSAVVFKAARSPLYGSMPLRTLRECVVRLGLKVLRDIVFSFAMTSRIFRVPKYMQILDALRLHGNAVGHATRTVCRYTSFDADYAFLCGLFHDIGISAALLAISESVPEAKMPGLELAWPAAIELHQEAAGIVAKLWRLPEDVRLVCSHHHHYTIDGYVHPLAAAVCVADHLATELGRPATADGTLRETADEQNVKKAIVSLGINDKTMLIVHKAAAETMNMVAA